MNMCGRGDKDIFAISKFLGVAYQNRKIELKQNF